MPDLAFPIWHSRFSRSTVYKMFSAYFTALDKDAFTPTDACRGPWDPDSCHAGPPTGLLVRAMERALLEAGSAQRLGRITVDLIRPVPMAGLQVQAEILRAGRSVSLLKAALIDTDGKERMTAGGLALRADLDRPLPTPKSVGVELASAKAHDFVFTRTLHGLAWFADSITVRLAPEETGAPGPTTLWMRSLPLLADEVPSPFQRICPLADCGNAISRNAEPWEVDFQNVDLTVMLHRDPAGEWFGSRSQSHWQPSGIGLSVSTLFDENGEVGQVLQTLLLTPRD